MKKIFSFFALFVFVFANTNIDGFRKSSSLGSEKDIFLPEVNYTAPAPGEAKVFDRSYENSPPVIPHSLDGLVPITKSNNMCVTCHMPEVAKDMGATPVPASHMFNFRDGKSDNGKLDDSRFYCTQCHVPQSNAPEIVKNQFKPVFRDKNSTKRSNLLEVINEGINKPDY